MYRLVNRQLVLVVTLIACGLAVFAVPHQTTLYPFLGLEAVIGLCDCGIDVAANAWMLEMWQDAANPLMQALHFVSAMARTVAFLSVPWFLSDTTHFRPSRISIPYSVASIMLSMAGTALFTLYYIMPYEEPQRPALDEERHISTLAATLSSENVSLPQPDSPTRRMLKVVVMVLIASLIVVFSSGINHMMALFVPSFALTIGYRKADSSLMSGVYQGSFAIGRLFCSILALKLDALTMLLTCFSLLVFGNVLLMQFADNSETMIWIAIVVLGLGCSSNYASTFVLLEQRINVTNSVSACLVFSSYLAATFLPLILGLQLHQHPFIFVYLNLASVSICFLLLFAFLLVNRCFR